MTNERQERTRPEWPKFEERHYRDPATGDLLVAEWRHFMPPRMDCGTLRRIGEGIYGFSVRAETFDGNLQQPKISAECCFNTPEGGGSAAVRMARALFAEFAGMAEKRKKMRQRCRARQKTRKALAAVAARVPRDAKGRFVRKEVAA